MKKTILLLFIISSILNAVDFRNLLQTEKQKYHAKSIAVVVIDSVNSRGYFVYEDSSERLAKKFTRDCLFEPGNAMMPISFALLLDKNSKWSNTKIIDCRNIDIKKENCKENYAKDAIVYSSSRS